MRQLFMSSLLMFSMVLVHAGESEYAEKPTESTPIEKPVKESWLAFGKRHAQNVGSGIKAGWNALGEMQEAQNPNIEEAPISKTPEKRVHLAAFHQPEHEQESSSVFNLNALQTPTQITENPVAMTEQPTVEQPVERSEQVEPATAEESKSLQKKSWASSLKDWWSDVRGGLDTDVDISDEDWKEALEGITQEDIDSVGEDTAIKGVKLTPGSLAKIQKIDGLLNSWKLAPITFGLRAVFPMPELRTLISEMATTERIPENVGERITDITSKIALLPQSAKGALGVAAMARSVETSQALDYAQKTFPKLAPMVANAQDVLAAKAIVAEHLEQNPGDLVGAARELHDKAVGSMKAPLSKLIKAVDNATEGKTRALEKTKKINRIIMHITVMMFAVTLTSMVLSIAEGATDNKALRKAMEAIMILDLLVIMGGLGYGVIRLGGALNKKPEEPKVTEPAVEEPLMAKPSEEVVI